MDWSLARVGRNGANEPAQPVIHELLDEISRHDLQIAGLAAGHGLGRSLIDLAETVPRVVLEAVRAVVEEVAGEVVDGLDSAHARGR